MQVNLNYLLLDVNKSIITFNNLNGGGELIYTNFRNYVDMEGESITTDMWMGSIQMAKWGNCFNKTTSIIENYAETPCVSGKRTVFFI